MKLFSDGFGTGIEFQLETADHTVAIGEVIAMEIVVSVPEVKSELDMKLQISEGLQTFSQQVTSTGSISCEEPTGGSRVCS